MLLIVKSIIVFLSGCTRNAAQWIAHAHVRTHAQIDVPKRGIYLVHLYRGCTMPGSRTAEPYATSTFSSFGNLHNLFHTGSTHAHSYSPWRRVPFAPHLLQHWLLTDIAVRPNEDSCEVVPPWSLELSLSNH